MNFLRWYLEHFAVILLVASLIDVLWMSIAYVIFRRHRAKKAGVGTPRR
jgi:hypothetical protein